MMERILHQEQSPSAGAKAQNLRKSPNSSTTTKPQYRRRLSNATNFASPAQNSNNINNNDNDNNDSAELSNIKNDKTRSAGGNNGIMIVHRRPSVRQENSMNPNSFKTSKSRTSSKDPDNKATTNNSVATNKNIPMVVSKTNFNQLSKSSDLTMRNAHQSTFNLTFDKRQRSGIFQSKNFVSRVLKIFGFLYQDVVLTDPEAIEAVHALGLTQSHLKKLKLKFDSIDVDGSGTIDADEFIESFGEKNSPFSAYLFTLIDIDHSGTIEFDEYIRVLATYCMYSKDEILRFCFSCFDVDGSGTIDEREFVELCKSVNNAAPAFPENFRRALNEFDVDHDGLIDYGEFIELDHRFPLILFPAFRLQDLMQRHTLGELTWLQLMRRYSRRKSIAKYKDTHGGVKPPIRIWDRFARLICPSRFTDEEFIELGEAFEIRQKEDREAKKTPSVTSKRKSIKRNKQ